MALFDKLSAAAKTASDTISAAAKSAKESANIAIETGKLTLKVKTENENIDQFKEQIGDILWSRYCDGLLHDDPQVIALCRSIEAANETIADLEKQIELVREQPEEPECAEPEEAAPALQRHCPQCGAEVPEDANFCNSCGSRL